MMDKKNTSVKVMSLLAALLIISSCFMFRDYLFGNQLMVFNDIGSDTWQQYIMNYTSIVNHLRDGSFSLWDFNNGMGINLFNFNLFDPFLMLLYAIGVVLGPAHMLLYINVIQVLKILAAGLVFYWYLSQFTFSAQAKVIASYTYGLNGFLFVWGQHYQFGTVVIYLPLLLLFCEKFVQKKRGRVFFPVIVFLCGIYSVYFTYMCLAATGVYLIFRIWMAEDLNLKEQIKKFLAGCGQMLLGLGMSLAVFLPMAEVLLNVSSRLDSDGTGIIALIQRCFTPYSQKFYISLLKRLFSSNLQNGYGLTKGPQKYALNYYEDPVLFCSVLSVFLSVQFLLLLYRTEMEKKTKRILYVAAAIILIGVFLPVGGIVFNYFTLPTQRYTFVLMPVFMLVLAWMWDYMRGGGRLNLIGLVIVACLMGWAYLEGWKQAGYDIYKKNIFCLAISGSIMLICLIALNVLRKQQIRSLAMGVLSIALVFNVVSEEGTNYKNRVTMKKTDTPIEVMAQETERYQEMRKSKDKSVKYSAENEKPQDFFREMYRVDLKECLDYLNDLDPDFFRVEKDYISGTVAMDSSAQGYRGISTYNSVMNGNVKDFVETCYPELFFADKNHYTFWNNVEDNWLAAFLGIKYILSGKDTLDESKYKLLDKVGSLYIHQNVLDTSIAHFYSTAISEESLRNLCSEETREKLLGETIALEDGKNISSIEELDAIKTDSVKKLENSSYVVLDAPVKDSDITGKIHADTDGYAVFMIPYEKGWNLTIDGKETELLKGDIGFLACKVAKGDHELTLRFQAPGLKAGLAGSGLCWLIFVILVVEINRKKKYNIY